MRFHLGRTIRTIIVGLIGALYTFPTFWMITSSMKLEKDLVAMKIFPKTWSLDNYYKIIEQAKIGAWFSNSMFITGITTLGVIVIGLMAGYALGRLKFPGKNIMYAYIIAGMVIPGEGIMITVFLTMKDLGLGAKASLIILHVASAVAVMILSNYFKGIANEFEEAARIDGAGEIKILTHIMIPMAVPAITTVAIVHFSWIWNDFLWPLIFATSDKAYTLPVGLSTLINNSDLRFGPVMAGSTLSVIPVVVMFLLFQRYFMRGIAGATLK
ncbi:MAG: carbohydrate ABC transporter permease [Spirochaetales bacterium]|nr:carbohydrate ABC transporter permease [Spirochaetales bacterium]